MEMNSGMSAGAPYAVCESSSSTILQHGVRYEPDVEVHQCAGCGLVYLIPRPNEDDLSDSYQALYRDEY